MKNMNGVNGGDNVLRIRLVDGKAEVKAGDNLSDVTNAKIREYFQQKVDTTADGVITDAEIKAHRNQQAEESADPTQWKTELRKDENGNTYEVRTRGAVTQYYDSSKRLVKVVTDKGGGVTDEVRYEYAGDGFDVINKMVIVNGNRTLGGNLVYSEKSADAPVGENASSATPPTVTENSSADRPKEVSPTVNLAGNQPVSEERGGADPAENDGVPPAPNGNSPAGSAAPVEQAAEPEETEASENAGAAEAVEETEEAVSPAATEEADEVEEAASQEEPEDAPEVTRNSKGQMVSYAKNGESFKQTAARLGFKPGTPEYKVFAEANKTAAKQGWFIVGKEVVIPKSIEDKVNKEGLNVDSNGEIAKYNKAITDGADVSKYEGKTETKTLDKNTTWWALAKESLAAEGKEAPTMAEIQARTGELMKLNEGKDPVKGAKVNVPKLENVASSEDEEVDNVDDTENTEQSESSTKTTANNYEQMASGLMAIESANLSKKDAALLKDSLLTLVEAGNSEQKPKTSKDKNGKEVATLADGRRVTVEERDKNGEIVAISIDKDTDGAYSDVYFNKNDLDMYYNYDPKTNKYSNKLSTSYFLNPDIFKLAQKIFG